MNSGRFQIGQPKIGGRRKGTPNKNSADVRIYCQKILQHLNVKRMLDELFYDEKGNYKPLTDVSSRVLIRLMEYGWGQPRQEVAIEVNLKDAIAQARQRVLDAPVLEGTLLPDPPPASEKLKDPPGKEGGPMLQSKRGRK